MKPTRPLGKKQLRKFGLTVGSVLVGLFGLALPLVKHHTFPRWPWVYAGSSLLVVALVWPELLRGFHWVWMRIAVVLGFINTRIILAAVFFVIVTPIGLVMRLLGRNPMRPKSNADSYRVASRAAPVDQMKEPF